MLMMCLEPLNQNPIWEQRDQTEDVCACPLATMDIRSQTNAGHSVFRIYPDELARVNIELRTDRAALFCHFILMFRFLLIYASPIARCMSSKQILE